MPTSRYDQSALQARAAVLQDSDRLHVNRDGSCELIPGPRTTRHVDDADFDLAPGRCYGVDHINKPVADKLSDDDVRAITKAFEDDLRQNGAPDGPRRSGNRISSPALTAQRRAAAEARKLLLSDAWRSPPASPPSPPTDSTRDAPTGDSKTDLHQQRCQFLEQQWKAA